MGRHIKFTVYSAMQLPQHTTLPIHRLAACFNNTSATYKFYWFLSILQAVEEGQTTIPKQTLFASMVANAWYTIHYFRVSFGKQDKLQDAVKAIKEMERLPIDANRNLIAATLVSTANPITINLLRHFDAHVPHRFLSPWQLGATERSVYEASQRFTNDSLYALDKDEISINPAWEDYLKANAGILRAFCYWNLALYLQAKNPNVPDIPNKLIKPAVRSSLLQQRKQYWDIVLNELQTVPCIYTGKALSVGHYAVEHFIPYSFVSHNLIWNLIPADPAFNSAKNDRLPPLATYFEPFFHLQQQAVAIISHKVPANPFLEDYLTIFPNLPDFTTGDEGTTKSRFLDTLQPLITIAANNGFEYLP